MPMHVWVFSTSVIPPPQNFSVCELTDILAQSLNWAANQQTMAGQKSKNYSNGLVAHLINNLTLIDECAPLADF